jgi:excisionase family DNA binding protein|tara:strand:- start:1752 stop:1997 length:246 start_codon:yes stop_codon:yes gene_type:complete
MSEPFVPIEELSKHFSVSISTIRSWIRQKHIPKSAYLKVGNTYRFRLSDVTEALKPTGSYDVEMQTSIDNVLDEAFADEDI